MSNEGSAANSLANFLAIDVGQHHVQNHQVRSELLDTHARVKTVVGRANVKASIPLEAVLNQIDQILIVINDQQLFLSAFQVRRSESRCPS